MKKFYTVFFNEIKFQNSPSLKDVLFVSLDKDSWLEIKDRKELSIEEYKDVKNIFTDKVNKDGTTSSFMKIATNFIKILANQSNKDFDSMVKTIK